MKVLHRFLSITALVGTGTAMAQQPGAVLLPAQVVSDPPATVIRGATPFEKAPTFAPVSWDSTPTATTPVPKFEDSNPVPKGNKGSWVSTQMNGVKNFIVGKPGDTSTNKPYAPFGPNEKVAPKPPVAVAPTAPVPPPSANGYPRPMAGSPVQQVAAVAPPSGVYAGPPAYRWYGWGSTTPGANPHAPTGNYPKASATWYSQTGATPGAFPIPVTLPRADAAGAEPPVYIGGPSSVAVESTGFTPGNRPMIAETEKPTAAVPTMTAPVPVPASNGLVPMASTVVSPSLAMPAGIPTPIATSTTPGAPVPAAEVPTPPNTMTWQPSSKPSMPSMPSSTPPVMPKPETETIPPSGTGPMMPSTPIQAPKIEDQAWGRPKQSLNTEMVPVSHTVVRGQQPHDPGTTLDMAIRNVVPSHIQRVEINRIGGNGLVIRFVVENENAAQDAATVVAQLPELKAFDVRYEALLLAR